MRISEQWLPESVRSLRTYSRDAFGADLLAGITVGLVALPLAMAFGIASGVTPQAGLYTAIIAGGLISALGGSRLQIGGHCRKVWRGWPRTGDDDGGRNPRDHGANRPGDGGQVHSSPGNDWFHEWDRAADCLDSDQGFPGTEDR